MRSSIVAVTGSSVATMPAGARMDRSSSGSVSGTRIAAGENDRDADPVQRERAGPLVGVHRDGGGRADDVRLAPAAISRPSASSSSPPVGGLGQTRAVQQLLASRSLSPYLWWGPRSTRGSWFVGCLSRSPGPCTRRWIRWRGQGGAPAAKRGRTTLTPTRIRRTLGTPGWGETGWVSGHVSPCRLEVAVSEAARVPAPSLIWVRGRGRVR